MGIHRVLAEDIFIVLLGYIVVCACNDKIGGLSLFSNRSNRLKPIHHKIREKIKIPTNNFSLKFCRVNSPPSWAEPGLRALPRG